MPRTKSAAQDAAGGNETIDEDDLCPICRLLLYQPVITQCNHVLCRSCMAAWADVLLSQSTTIVPVTEEAADFDAVSGLEARCPMCRTQTSASVDDVRAGQLLAKYPESYAEREVEERDDPDAGESVQTVTLHVGNLHGLVEPRGDIDANRHEWTIFVRPSRTDIIEEIQIFLHPTFNPNRIIRQRAPFEVRRVGWGVFTIVACVILKAGFTWMSSDAEDSPDGAPKGMLKLDWDLDFASFGATGAMRRNKLKVKNDRNWEDDEEERDQAEWNRTLRQYQRDGNWVPSVEE